MKKYLLSIMAACIIWSCNKDDDDDNGTNGTDTDFVLKTSMGNTAEIDAGQLAATKGLNTGVRMFGQMMVTDHNLANTRLDSIALNLSLHAPDSLDAEHVALKSKLMSLSGRAFDSVYITSQVADHQKTIALFENEADKGKNGQLRNYANSLLPNLRMHLHMADSLNVYK
jgi:putative membrane protein